MKTDHIHTLEEMIQTIFIVSSRRSSLKFAEETMTDTFDMLKTRYPLFENIEIKKTMSPTGAISINISENVTSLHPSDIARGMETLIRIIYDEISEKSGLYFITEIKNHLKKESINHITMDFGIDLDQLQNEQHFKYNRKLRKKELRETEEKENPLGYTWSSVKNWNYNNGTKQVELYDDQGHILDKIDLQQAIQKYVENLSGITETSPLELQQLLEEHEKAYSFLKLIYHENIDFDTAKKMLNLSESEIHKIISELIEIKFLQYVSDDEVELTESGKEFIS